MPYLGNIHMDIKANQARFDAEALAGKCFYCHEPVEGDAMALHLANARGVKQHIHGECDKNLRGELAFEQWQEERDIERLYEPEHDAPVTVDF